MPSMCYRVGMDDIWRAGLYLYSIPIAKPGRHTPVRKYFLRPIEEAPVLKKRYPNIYIHRYAPKRSMILWYEDRNAIVFRSGARVACYGLIQFKVTKLITIFGRIHLVRHPMRNVDWSSRRRPAKMKYIR